MYDLRRRVLEERPGAGRKILEPGSQSNDQVGAGGRGIGDASSRDADTPQSLRMVPGQCALAGLRLAHGNAEYGGELGKLVARA